MQIIKAELHDLEVNTKYLNYQVTVIEDAQNDDLSVRADFYTLDSKYIVLFIEGKPGYICNFYRKEDIAEQLEKVKDGNVAELLEIGLNLLKRSKRPSLSSITSARLSKALNDPENYSNSASIINDNVERISPIHTFAERTLGSTLKSIDMMDDKDKEMFSISEFLEESVEALENFGKAYLKTLDNLAQKDIDTINEFLNEED